MSDQKTPEELAAEAAAKAQSDAEAKAAKKAAKAVPVEDATTLRFIGTPYSGTLRIGTEEFAVVDGAVEVPSRLFAAAHQAGFR